MNPILRRSALATALALAFAQASAAPVDLRSAIPAQRVDADTIASAATFPEVLILRAGIYDPASQRLDVNLSGAADDVSSRYAIVQFHAEALDAGRKALQAKGAEFVGYVPNNAYFVRLNNLGLDAVKRSDGVRAAEYYAAAYKIDPRLWTDARATLLPQIAEDSADPNLLLDIVNVRGFKGESSAQLEAALRKLVPGVHITGRSLRADAMPYVHAGVPRAQLDALLHAASALDAVAFIEPWLPTRLHNAASIGTIQGNSLNTSCPGNGTLCGPTPLFDHGIMGSGQIVAVADSGTSPWVAYFTTLNKGAGPVTQITLSDNPAPVPPAIGNLYPTRKIIGYWLQPSFGGTGPVDYDLTSGHGTHTSGTVVGDLAGTFANTYLASTPTAHNHEEADGMAPNAQLLMQDVGGTAATAVYVNDFAGTLNRPTPVAHASTQQLGRVDGRPVQQQRLGSRQHELEQRGHAGGRFGRQRRSGPGADWQPEQRQERALGRGARPCRQHHGTGLFQSWSGGGWAHEARYRCTRIVRAIGTKHSDHQRIAGIQHPGGLQRHIDGRTDDQWQCRPGPPVFRRWLLSTRRENAGRRLQPERHGHEGRPAQRHQPARRTELAERELRLGPRLARQQSLVPDNPDWRRRQPPTARVRAYPGGRHAHRQCRGIHDRQRRRRRRVPRDPDLVRPGSGRWRRLDPDQQPRSGSRCPECAGLQGQRVRLGRFDDRRHGRCARHCGAGPFYRSACRQLHDPRQGHLDSW